MPAGRGARGRSSCETLNILEGYDLAGMDRFSAEVYHLILEALKASFADRDRYYGDPRFVDVPMDGLLSKDVRGRVARPDRPARGRRRACPSPATPGATQARRRAAGRWQSPSPTDGPVEPDTSYLCVVDR